METERRKAPRKTPTEFTFIKLEQEFGGRVLNCSEEGLCFETMSPINESDLIQFWFSLHTLERVEGFGQIVWMNQARNVGGIKITHLSRTSRLKFEGWLSDPAHSHVIGPEDDAPAAFHSVPAASATKAQDQAPIPKAPSLSTTTPLAADVPVELAMSSEAATAEAGVPEPSQARHWPTSASTAPPIQPNFGPASATGAMAESSAPAFDSYSSPHPSPLPTRGAPAPAGGDSLPPAIAAQVEPFEDFKWAAPIAPQASSREAAGPWFDSHSEPESSHFMAAPENDAPSIPGSSLDYPAQPDLESRELVPLSRHLTATRMQFIRGAVLGILVCSLIVILVSKFSKPLGPSVSAQVSSPPAAAGAFLAEAQPNSETPSSSLTRVVSIPALAIHSHVVNRSSASALPKIIPGALQQSSRSTSTASSTDAAPTTEQVAEQSAALGQPTPAVGNAVTAYHPAPLFETPKRPLPPEPLPAAVDIGSEPSAARAAPDPDVVNGFPSFHRKDPLSPRQVGGEVRPARLIKSVQPVYPLAAKTRNISGDVVIDAVVTTSGNVTEARVLSGPMLLHQPALEAASQLKYEPALLDGKPTAQHVTIKIKFHAP
jgi:TonB family protein